MTVFVVLPEDRNLELGPPLGVFRSIDGVKAKFPEREWTHVEHLGLWEGRRSDDAVVKVYEEEVKT